MTTSLYVAKADATRMKLSFRRGMREKEVTTYRGQQEKRECRSTSTLSESEKDRVGVDKTVDDGRVTETKVRLRREASTRKQ